MRRCPYCKEPLKTAKLLICPYCGIELRKHKDKDETERQRRKNVWLLTDPTAKEDIKLEGNLAKLKYDIKYHVMINKLWDLEDLAYIDDVIKLEKKGIITKTTKYWYASPFPTIYKANHRGKLNILGKKFHYKKGDEIVWQSQKGRELHNLEGPIMIGKFSSDDLKIFTRNIKNLMKTW